jgi:hypothetical protein
MNSRTSYRNTCHHVSPGVTRHPGRQRFLLQVEGDAGQHDVDSLRRLLKALTRRYGLRCVAVEELMDHQQVEATERSNDAVPARDRATG